MQAYFRQSYRLSESAACIYAPGLPLSLFLQVSRPKRPLRRSIIAAIPLVLEKPSIDVAHLGSALHGRAGSRTCSECGDMSGI